MTTNYRYCDGLRRRDMLRVGTAGLLGLGLSLPELLMRQARSAEPASGAPPDVSLIILFLKGGLSTIDTWDPKPEAPAEFRGSFQPIDTNVPGIRIGEHLPLTARQMDKFSLIRSFGHRSSDHGPADHYMLTGYHPLAGFNPNLNPNNQRPAHGSIIAKTLGPKGSVPPYVCLPRVHPSSGAAYLGASAAPFVVEADPNAPNFAVPDLTPPLAVRGDRLENRQELLAGIDRFRQSAETRANKSAQAVSTFQKKAFELMTSSATRAAFDMQHEPVELRDDYGRNSLGQSCLMARRLVEAGVRCVTIDHTNWDTHDNNFHVLKTDLLPVLDRGLSALFRDLYDRRLLDSTLVLVTGEFGRTPRINQNSGRDHWGPAFTVALGGGGVHGGRVVGQSDKRAERPDSAPIGPEDLVATMYRLLGINPDDEFYTPEGRPVKIVNGGKVVSELL
ncbi:MAG: DUF1501 domain-containing protein [Planctomycetaceae bacterium]|nr:DUF1501 domain-containing protein [Planctomycetaceae bacterium]